MNTLCLADGRPIGPIRIVLYSHHFSWDWAPPPLSRGADGESQSLAASETTRVERIVLELERLAVDAGWLDDAIVGETLTAVQAHLLVGETLDRIAVPRPAHRSTELAPGRDQAKS